MADSVSIKIDKDLRPAYYDDFHCLAADCRFSCCKNWRIAFDKKDYLSLKRQKGTEDLNNRLEHGLRRIRKGPLAETCYGEFDMSGGDCPLLREDGLCALQIEKDHAALPQVCRVFPRARSYLPEYLERSLSPACEGVLELLWNLPDGVEFRSDPLPKKEQKILTVPEGRPLVPFFQTIREWCIDMLQDRRLPLPQRILLTGFALRELAEGEMDLAAWLARARALPEAKEIPDLPREESALAMFLSSNLHALGPLETASVDYTGIQGEILRALGVTIQAGTTRAAIPLAPYRAARQRYEEKFKDREYFMENLMVSLFFQLNLPNLKSGEELWKSYVNFCNLYAFYRFMAVASCREGGAGDKAELFRLIVFASRGMIHNGARQTALRDELFQNDSATLAHMAILLGG